LSRADKCRGRGLIPAVPNGGNEENDKKTNKQVSGKGLIPAVPNGGNEENDKKNQQK